jgi:D-tyrosyl-tRNA(Tyr) deacylase
VRALVQRVARASVTIQRREVAGIGNGFVILIGIGRDDSDEDARYIVEKCVNLRIFPDAEGRFNLSALDVKGALLLVSQFTLFAETRKGRRPSFTEAAPPEIAAPAFERLVGQFRATGLEVQTGRFQEHMLVEIHNDGPVTIMIDSAERHLNRSGEQKP